MPDEVSVGPLLVRRYPHEVLWNGAKLGGLRPAEIHVLHAIASGQGTNEQLKALYPGSADPMNLVTSYIVRIRRALAKVGAAGIIRNQQANRYVEGRYWVEC